MKCSISRSVIAQGVSVCEPWSSPVGFTFSHWSLGAPWVGAAPQSTPSRGTTGREPHPVAHKTSRCRLRRGCLAELMLPILCLPRAGGFSECQSRSRACLDPSDDRTVGSAPVPPPPSMPPPVCRGKEGQVAVGVGEVPPLLNSTVRSLFGRLFTTNLVHPAKGVCWVVPGAYPEYPHRVTAPRSEPKHSAQDPLLSP